MSTGTSIADAAANAADRGASQMESLSASARQVMDQATQGAGSALRRVGARGKTLGRQLSARQQVWTEDARGCVRDHPLVSVAVAVGAGLLLSRLLSR